MMVYSLDGSGKTPRSCDSCMEGRPFTCMGLVDRTGGRGWDRWVEYVGGVGIGGWSMWEGLG